MHRSTRRTRLAGAAISIPAILLAACLPERSNPNDPALRPRAALEVASGPATDDVCGPIDSVAETLNRARCLHLIADGSSDPQDDIAVYEFALLDTAGTAAFSSTVEIPPAGGPVEARAEFTPGQLRTLPGGLYSGRVTVTDRAGHTHVAETAVLLENARPVAAQPGPRRIDHWAPAWDPGSEMVVAMSGAGGFDPDGDPFRYCWRSIGQTAPLGPVEILDDDGHCYADPWLQVTADTQLDGKGHVLLEHWLDDEGGESERVLAAIVLDALPGWAFEEATGRAKVLDVDRRVFPVRGMDDVADVSFALPPEQSVVIARGYDDQLHRFLIGAGEPANDPGAVAVSLGVDRILGVEAVQNQDLVWVTAAEGGYLQVHALRKSDLVEIGFAVTTEQLCSQDTPLGGAGPDGSLWIGQMLCGEVRGYRYDAQLGAVVEIDPAAFGPPAVNEMLTSLSLREGDSPGAPMEVWAVYGPDVLQGFDGTTWARVRLPDGTVVPRVEFEPDVAVGFSLSFFHRREAWFNDFTVGMSLFECVGCDPAGAWPPSGESPRMVRVHAVEGSSAGFLTAVQRSGTVVFATTERFRIERIALDGSFAGHDTVTRVHGLLGPDPEGDLWTALAVDVPGQGSQLWFSRGEGSGIEGVVREIPVGLGFADPTVDYASGDLWTGTILPVPGAARIYPDGRQADLISAVTDGTGSTRLAPPIAVASDPHAGYVWIVAGGNVGGDAPSGNTVYVVDPYAPRLVAGTAMTAAGASIPAIGPSDLGAGERIVRAIPQFVSGATPRHALLLLTLSEQPLAGGECAAPALGGAFHAYLRRYVLETGTLSAPTCLVGDYRIQGSDGIPHLSRDLAGGAVCVATAAGGDPHDIARLLRFDADLGNPVGYETAGDPGFDSAYVQAVAAAPGQCWMAMTIDGTPRVAVIEGGNGKSSDPLDAPIPRALTLLPVLGPQHVGDAPSAVTEVWIGGTTDVATPAIGRVLLSNDKPIPGRPEEAFPIEFDTVLLQP